MPIRRAKPVDQLYEECRDADLVLVPDPALAGALNRRLESPHLGTFATTPRRYAAGRREGAEDRVAFLEVIDSTDLDWKEAAYTVGNVLQCWEHRGAVEAILEYPAYSTAATEAVVDVLRGTETSMKRLSEASIDDSRAVAVVGVDQLSPIERSFLPDGYCSIDPLGDASFDPPPFRLFESTAAIVDTVVDAISAENADRVAVVLDRSSRYASLLEASLEAAAIPYHGGPGFIDHPDHRAFLSLLRASRSGSSLRVADVRPILSHLGVDIDIEHNEKRVAALDRPELDWLVGFFEAVGRYTFDEALAAYEVEVRTTLDAFGEELARLGLSSELVTRSAVDDLAFYLQSYDVPIDRRDEGVLLADATGGAIVDRPAVFYLGLDDGWIHAAPRRPWVDRSAAFERNLDQFQLLIQNGVEQHYLVQDERGGRPIPPCLYFQPLLETPFERFSDMDTSRHARIFRPAGDGFDHEPVGVDPDPVESVSQSSLNTFVNSPRDYLFDRLVDAPDRDYFTVGTLFHDFAEVVVAEPALVDAAFIDETVELMLAETRAFDRGPDRAVNRTRYRVGLETIVEYLEANPPTGAPFVTSDTGWGRNTVADHFGIDVDAPHAELWFDDPSLGLKGKVDLVHGPTRLLDYKSGSRYPSTEIVRRSALDPPHEKANYQALLYLAWLRRRKPDERLEFTFFHFLETLDDVVAGEHSIEDCLASVTYYPVTFATHAASREVWDALRHDAYTACTKTFAQVDYDTYRGVADAHPFPATTDSAELVNSTFGQALADALEQAVGQYAYVERGGAQALRYLRDLRDSSFFADDVDEFEAFVADRIGELNRYRSGAARFPVAGIGREPNYRWVNHRDLLLEGDG